MQKSEKQKRSESLNPAERARFQKWVDRFDTQEEAYTELEVSRGTLERLLFKGSGSPDNIAKIRSKINPVAAA